MGRTLAVVVTLVLACACCFGSGMESTSRYTGNHPRSDGVIATASRETGCATNELRVVAETGRRYVNETAFRFVLEGCGERLGFLETCDLGRAGSGTVAVNDSLGCSYLLVTRVPLRPAPDGGSPPVSAEVVP